MGGRGRGDGELLWEGSGRGEEQGGCISEPLLISVLGVTSSGAGLGPEMTSALLPS